MAALLVTGAAVVAGFDWRLVVLTLVTLRFPWVLVAVAVVWGLVAAVHRRGRPGRPGSEAAFHAAVASELRGGASLRSALREAAAATPELDLRKADRRLAAGVNSRAVAAALRPALPVTGTAAAAAVELSAASGAGAAAMFDVLAERAAFHSELDRERRALTAQARFSALIVGGGPLLFALVLLVTGRAGTLLEHGSAGMAIGGVGLGLAVAGLLGVWLLMRKELR